MKIPTLLIPFTLLIPRCRFPITVRYTLLFPTLFVVFLTFDPRSLRCSPFIDVLMTFVVVDPRRYVAHSLLLFTLEGIVVVDSICSGIR